MRFFARDNKWRAHLFLGRGLLDLLQNPFEAFFNSFAAFRWAGLDLKSSVFQFVKLKFSGHVCARKRVSKSILEQLTRSQLFQDLVYSRTPGTALLLVCLLAGDRQIPEKDKIISFGELSNLCSFLKSANIGTVNDVDENIGVFEIIWPVRTQPTLPANVPHIQLEAVCVHRLDVKTLRRRYFCDVFAWKLLDDCRFS